MGIFDQDLYQILLENQIASATDLKKILKYSKNHQISFYEMILRKDLISDTNLGKLISDFYKIPLILLEKQSIPNEVLEIVPSTLAEKFQTITFEADSKVLKVATSIPVDNQFINMLHRKTGLQIELYYTTPQQIEESLRFYKKGLKNTFDELLKEQLNAAGKAVSKDLPITKMVDLLIEYAYEDKASDIHIEPDENFSLVRFRIDGVLHDVLKLPMQMHDQVITRIKVLSRLRTDEHLSAQDGKMQIKLDRENLDVRVSIVPIVEGEKCVLRLLTSRFRQFGLVDLGMDEADLKKVQDSYNQPYGMILSTGPTGSGKTTSIYAILKLLNTREKNIATIEDPVEYDIDGINQIQANPKTNLTFAEGLRSILRQDPDIIYVGEIRDEETADIAINSALTGHLVLSTLHTNDSATALPRLIDMKIEPFLVASTVNIIIAQRLVRKICEKCKISFTQKTAELSLHIRKELILKHLGEGEEVRIFRGKGCPVCHSTGYEGRIGIFEVLRVSEAVKELITQKSDSDVIMKKAIGEGMSTMLEDGLKKVQLGLTTIEEILRVTNE